MGCSLRVRRRSAAPTPGLALPQPVLPLPNSVGNVKESRLPNATAWEEIPTCPRARARLTCSCLGRVIAPFGLTRAATASTCKHEAKSQVSAWLLTRAGARTKFGVRHGIIAQGHRSDRDMLDIRCTELRALL